MELTMSKIAAEILIFLLGCNLMVFLPYDVRKAEKIAINVEAYRDRPASSHIVSEEDSAALRQLFGRGLSYLDSPSCPCGGVEIVFYSRNGEMVLHPAGDSCDTIRLERNGTNYYFHMGDTNNAKLRELLNQYQVVWPFGI